MQLRTPDDRARAATVAGACALFALAVALDGDGGTAARAALLAVGGGRARSGVATLVGWLVGGALLGAAGGYAAVALVALPLSTQGAVGLGIALGGGLGAVSNLLAADDDVELDGERDAVTVEMEADESAPSPRPADLFDGHPDPVLYVADEGHGPVVMAANRAYAETFDVAAATITGTPLDEALFVEGDPSPVAGAVAAGETVDEVFACQTPDGERSFRLRTVGGDGDGYVVYTPTDREP